MGIKSRRSAQGQLVRFRRAEVTEALAQLKNEDLQLLHWLLRYPFLRAEDLAQARSMRISTVYRHLAFQQEIGVVESITPAVLGTNRCALYYLSNLGLHVVAANMHRSPAALARHCHTDEQGLLTYLPRLSQLMILQDLINGIDALAPEKLGLFGHRAAVWWACVRDYRHTFAYRDRTLVAEASGGLVLQVRPRTAQGKNAPDRWYSLFILLDDGISSTDLITDKLRGLLAYRESAERRKQCSDYDFPPILVLATTVHRQEHWVRKAREVVANVRMTPLVGAITSLEEIERKENRAKFPWLTPWRDLTSNATCHLHDLLEPIPHEALPRGLLLPHEWQDLDCQDLPPAITPRQMSRCLPAVIQGHFTRRAEQLPAEEQSGRDEREHIALLSLKLTRRLLDLLVFILDHPLISLAEIAALQGMQLASAERYLRELRRLGCLELVDTRRYQQEICKRVPDREGCVVQADIGQRWQLSACGMRLLAAAYHFNVHNIALLEGTASGEQAPVVSHQGESLVQRISVSLLRRRRVEHHTGIYGFFADLCRAAQYQREQGYRHQLLWWRWAPSYNGVTIVKIACTTCVQMHWQPTW